MQLRIIITTLRTTLPVRQHAMHPQTGIIPNWYEHEQLINNSIFFNSRCHNGVPFGTYPCGQCVAPTTHNTGTLNMNTNDTTLHTVRTKLDARATEKKETAATIDWSNISPEDTRKLAAKTIIISAQSEWRATGSIPESVTLDANTYANPTRKPRGPVDVRALLAKMTPEERAELMASLA